MYDFNETNFDSDWYMEIVTEIFEPLGVPKERRMLSLIANDFDILRDEYIKQEHGVSTLKEYFAIDRFSEWSVMASSDGLEPVENPEHIVYWILKYGDIGFENNRYHIEATNPIGYISISMLEGMEKGFLRWYGEQ